MYIVNNSPLDIKNLKSMITIHKDMEKENYCIVLNESTTKLNEIFSNYDIKNIIKSNIFVIKGNIMILDKNIRLLNKKTIKIFNKIATDLLERW